MPSYASMMCQLAMPFTDALDPAAMASHWVEKWQRGLAATQRFRDQHPDSRYIDVRFTESLSEPEQVIHSLYRFAGLELSEQTRLEMRRWREFNRRESRPEHHYTMEEFGLTPEALEAQFADYISRYLAH